MKTEHDKAVALAEKHCGAVTGLPAWLFDTQELTAMLADYRDQLAQGSGVMPVVMCVAGDLQDDVPVITEARVREAIASLEARNQQLQAKLQDAEQEVDSLKDQIDEQNTWPDWANQILKMVRERSGNDGYDDMSEGVDLPDEVDEALSELAAQAERANAKLGQSEARVMVLHDLLTGRVRGALAAIAVDNMGGNISVARSTAKFAIAAIDAAINKESGK